MARQEAVERLRALEVYRANVEENAGIFERHTDVEAIGKECGRNRVALSGRQFLYFHLGALLKKDPDYRAGFLEGAKQQLGDTGVKPEHVEEYFQSDADPHIVFAMKHREEYGDDVLSSFVDKADSFALRGIRQWLGFE